MKRLFLTLLLLPMLAQAEVITVTWTNATEREDGTPFDAATEQLSVRLYCDGPPGSVPTITTSPGDAESMDMDFPVGNTTCEAATVDIDLRESDRSVPKTWTVTLSPVANPNPPTFTSPPNPSP